MDNVNEKWSGDTEIKSTGKWADKTIAELKKARSALKDKEDRTKEETSKLRQINFAIRSKKDWKGGVDEAGKPSRPRKGKLVDKKTGQEVRLPYETVDFRGDKIVITGYQAPHKRGSTGRIYTDDGGSYFPGVADLKIIDYGPLEEADGSGSYGGQSPLTYQHDDDELNKITKLSGLGEAKRKPRPDDFDEDDEDTPEDPDKDKVPHILMQIKKAIDVDGDYDIKFEDGGKHKFSITDLNMFFKKYMSMRPVVREQMQEVAIMGKEEFDTILSILNPKKK